MLQSGSAARRPGSRCRLPVFLQSSRGKRRMLAQTSSSSIADVRWTACLSLLTTWTKLDSSTLMILLRWRSMPHVRHLISGEPVDQID